MFRLKNKILIKNKRLKPEVEKVELDQFWKGEFSIGDYISYFKDRWLFVIVFYISTIRRRSLDLRWNQIKNRRNKKNEWNPWKESESKTLDNHLPDETEEPKEDAEGGQALLKKEDPVAGTVGQLTFLYLYLLALIFQYVQTSLVII